MKLIFVLRSSLRHLSRAFLMITGSRSIALCRADISKLLNHPVLDLSRGNLTVAPPTYDSKSVKLALRFLRDLPSGQQDLSHFHPPSKTARKERSPPRRVSVRSRNRRQFARAYR